MPKNHTGRVIRTARFNVVNITWDIDVCRAGFNAGSGHHSIVAPRHIGHRYNFHIFRKSFDRFDQCHGRSLTDAAETRISHHAGNIEKTFPIDRLPFQGLFQGLRNNDRAASAGRTFAAGIVFYP